VPEPGDSVWVLSDLAADGTYVTTVQAGPDHARVLDRSEALAYAGAVLEAAARAEHDAAVLAQLHNFLGLPVEAAAGSVADLRAERPPIDPAALAPIGLVPGVSASTKLPFLILEVDGAPVGQWTVTDARRHAEAVLEVSAAADLDAAYFRWLVGAVALDAGRARNVVSDLASHRPPREEEPHAEAAHP
jgi:hypothetical protein